MDLGVVEVSRKQAPKSALLTILAKIHLGEVAAVIVSKLVSHGRLNARELSSRSKMSLKQVKSGLVSLIQLNCIHYWKDTSSSVVYYSLNESGLMLFLHSGDVINHIKMKFGEEAAEITQNLIENGHIKIAEFLSNIQDPEVRHSKQNILYMLYNEGWLKRLQRHSFSPLDDLWQAFLQETLKNTPRSSTTSEIKRLSEAKEKANQKIRGVLEPDNESKEVFSIQDGIRTLNSDIIVTFNNSRYEKHLRTEALVDLVRSRVGILTAKVYETALNLIEKNSPDLRHYLLEIDGVINDPEEERIFINSIENKLVDDKKITFNLREVAKMLPKDLDLRNSILTHNFLVPNSKKRVKIEDSDSSVKRPKSNGNGTIERSELESSDHIDNSSDNSEPHALSLVNQHLKLLASSTSCPFLIEITPGTFTVPFTTLVDNLKHYHYETLIKSTLGQEASRILRCLKSLKLADEKSISNSILLKEKTVRNELHKMVKMNIVEIQEIARSADRAASKTVYLFRHKPKNSYMFLSKCLLYIMSELFINMEDLKKDHKILLEKCDREDVKGFEEELLLDSEIRVLKSLQQREIDNIGKINKLISLFNIFGTC